MPKSTKKYVSAVRTALSLGLKYLPGDQDTLYSWLSEHQHAWDSTEGQWLSFENEPAAPPTPFVMIRVWCNGEFIFEVSDIVIEQLKKAHFKLVECSESYPCRPPKQLEKRVYLKFEPPMKEEHERTLA